MNKNKASGLILLTLVFFFTSMMISDASSECHCETDNVNIPLYEAATKIDIENCSYEGNIPAYQNTTLSFTYILSVLNIISDVDVNLSVDFNAGGFPVFNRQISIMVNNSESISLTVDCIFDVFGFLSQLGEDLPNMPSLEDLTVLYRYNCFYRVLSNVSIDILTLRFVKNIDFGLDPNKSYVIGSYTEGESSITLLETQESSSEEIIESKVTNLQPNAPVYFSIMETKPKNAVEATDWSPLIIYIILSFLGVFSIVLVISKQDYIRYLKNRIVSVDNSTHRLTLDEVLENENRSNILDLILEKPGMHFNELLRNTGISPGNLVWHLDILQSYKIIGKKRFENFVVYFPYYQKNPLSNIDLKLQKSELTLKVLKFIEKNPGTWNSLIAKQLGINRKTIQYHVQKLIDLDLIFLEKSSSKNKIYLKIDN